jgi:hypothetical protein
MSPPSIDTETPAKTKTRKKCSDKQLIANRENAKRSRGAVTPRGKYNSKYNACKHNLRAESPVLPGEDGDELLRRLKLWPGLMGVGNDLEWSIGIQAVHMEWRMERANRSEDAAAERQMIEITKQVEDAQESETLLLLEELDSDLDPAGVLRKLHRTPAGCRALLNEWTCLQTRSNTYQTLFWSQRERLFHMLGKRLRDLFRDDPVITRWIVALMGAVFGDSEEDKAQQIGHVLEGLRPAWMADDEYAKRMSVLAELLPSKATATAQVRAYTAAAIADLNQRLKRAEANAKHELRLELEKAWVDDSPAGARRLNYKLGHDRSFHAQLRRLNDLQKARRAEGETMDDDPMDDDPLDTTVPGGSPAIEVPISEAPADPVARRENDPTDSAGGGRDDLPLTNEPIFPPVGPVASGGNDPTDSAAGGRDDLPLTNDPIFLRAAPRMPPETHAPGQEAGKPPPDQPPA